MTSDYQLANSDAEVPLTLALALGLTLGAAAASFAAPALEPPSAAFLMEHCLRCHGPEKAKGDLRLDKLEADFSKSATAARWQEILARVQSGEMPPKNEARPDPVQSQAFTRKLSARLNEAAARRRAEGRVVLRRLNRTEYENTVRDLLDPAVLELAITRLSHASRVEFYGFGASGSVAADAQHKFFRLQVSSAAYTDPHIQLMSAISLGENDVVVAISQSGRSKALLQSVNLALEAGATVIGLAPQNTPLSELCSIAIHVNVEEDQHEFTPVSSRIAHLLVIDVLAMGVARSRKTLLKDHLKRMNKSLRTLRTYKS